MLDTKCTLTAPLNILRSAICTDMFKKQVLNEATFPAFSEKEVFFFKT